MMCDKELIRQYLYTKIMDPFDNDIFYFILGVLSQDNTSKIINSIQKNKPRKIYLSRDDFIAIENASIKVFNYFKELPEISDVIKKINDDLSVDMLSNKDFMRFKTLYPEMVLFSLLFVDFKFDKRIVDLYTQKFFKYLKE